MQIVKSGTEVPIDDQNNLSSLLEYQEKIKNERNEKLIDPKIKKIYSDYGLELTFGNQYLWRSNPARQSEEVYDDGKVNELNKEWEKEAVRTVVEENALIRTSTGNKVEWSESQEKWIDIRK